jgi:D-xylono/L-arabinono-1,4-lactonase
VYSSKQFSLASFGYMFSRWTLMSAVEITAAADVDCELAENPLWDDAEKCVCWTDIPAGRIFRLKPAASECECIYRGDPVGGFTLQEDGSLLLFRVNDISVRKPDGTVHRVREVEDNSMVRFNDVCADPAGRVFAGTIGATPESGGLYRIDLDGAITKLFSGTGCSNGMGFSPDLKLFYWTCSTTRRIFQFDFDPGSGALSERRLFYKAAPEEGIPDGLAVDSEGCVWSARWGGGSVARHAPDGRVIGRLQFPETNITSLCFGGENLDELFVTAAKDEGAEAKAAKALFHARVNIGGQRENRSRIIFSSAHVCKSNK